MIGRVSLAEDFPYWNNYSFMNPIKTTPKDFFLHLGSMVMLYVSAVSLINLVFQTINYANPDQLNVYVDPYSSGIRLAIASLVIVFPLYLLLSWLIERDIRAVAERANFSIRKWLIYLTLFVAGLTVAIDLIVLINTFLGGEITTRFILKVITVLVVVGGVFGYFIYDLRRTQRAVPGKNKYFAAAAALLVLAAIVGGFLIMGSPAAARDQQLDNQRVEALRGIQDRVVNYWQQKGTMPTKLSDLEDSISGYTLPTLPDGSNYTYNPQPSVGPTSFQLCATFSRQSDAQSIYNGPMYPAGGIGQNWQHPAGQYCFSRTIDPKLYPVYSNTVKALPVPQRPAN